MELVGGVGRPRRELGLAAFAVGGLCCWLEMEKKKGRYERERKGEWVYIKVKFKIITSCHSIMKHAFQKVASFTKGCVPFKKLVSSSNRRSEKLASRENESCVYRKDKKAWVI